MGALGRFSGDFEMIFVINETYAATYIDKFSDSTKFWFDLGVPQG